MLFFLSFDATAICLMLLYFIIFIILHEGRVDSPFVAIYSIRHCSQYRDDNDSFSSAHYSVAQFPMIILPTTLFN
jgi:hypothetical protein